ncbi:hypothetical protein [Aliivibrio sp. SR45-2]|uniref:hypothetical protein n=1 Tax=Aliivibrio sp. SR45-2 TaxID=2760931 RepID=UPI0015F8D6D2|nr:hypothetical protein [Aliivibrio sp. SR45-2]MBB1313416.1 hypothetical protein [Aliivibrio sp. SR45-2]
MKSHLKLKMFTFITSFILTGCNSEDIFENGEAELEKKAELYDIVVSPSDVDIYLGQQYLATGKYDDGTEADITNIVTWKVLDNIVASSLSSGYVTPKNIGTTKIIANIKGITSNEGNINVIKSLVCGHDVGNLIATAIDNNDRNNAATKCLKIAQDNKGNWFTSSPSIELLNYFGYSKEVGNSGNDKTYANVYDEDGTYGPYGKYGLFDQLGGDSFGVNGQYDRWCQNLSSINFAGKENWQRTLQTELHDNVLTSGLYFAKGDMTANYGWPGAKYKLYWSSTPESSDSFKTVRLYDGLIGSASFASEMYASCISK